jgi:hypothetical protein
LSANVREEAQKVKTTTETLNTEKAKLSEVRAKIKETQAKLAKLLEKEEDLNGCIQKIESTLQVDLQSLQKVKQ